MASESDDQHPAERHSEAAAEEIRAFNHATFMRDSIEFPSTVYRTMGEMYTLAGYLEQAYNQLAAALTTQLNTGRLGVDEGTTFAGQPALAVETARAHLQHASEAIRTVYDDLTQAQTAIAGVYADDPT